MPQSYQSNATPTHFSRRCDLVDLARARSWLQTFTHWKNHPSHLVACGGLTRHRLMYSQSLALGYMVAVGREEIDRD